MKNFDETVKDLHKQRLVAISFSVALACALVILTPTVHAQSAPKIIFRLDDVQDWFANNGTMAVMDLFMAKKVPLTTAIIASAIGKDSSVVGKTAEGIKSGLFEPALHGYLHVDYTQLSPSNQSTSITRGNTIIKSLFGVHPFVFVPPYNTYNNETLGALTAHDMNVLSSTLGTESSQRTDNNIYNASQPCGTAEAGVVCHIPARVSAANDFRVIEASNITHYTNAQLVKQMADNVRKYGYSVLVLHPTDFVYTDAKTGRELQNKVDPRQLAQLNTLVDVLKTKYAVSSMEDLVRTTTHGTTTFEVQAKPRKVAVLTLDDDWVGQFKYAVPILRHYGFNATFFVTCQGPTAQEPDFVRGKNPGITSWDQLRQVKAMGFDIQNHGMTHHSLVDQPATVLQREIVDSKACLDNHLGIHSKVFAPAFAKPEDNATVNGYLAKAGYEFARNGYGKGEFTSQRFDLPTMSMNQWDKQFGHVTADILPNFADDVQKAQLPVLVYHNVNNLKDTESNWHNSTTTPETFDAEMKWLHDNGYEVHAIGDLHYDADHKEFVLG